MKQNQLVFTTVLSFMFVFASNNLQAQKINQFSQYKIIESEHGSKKIRITPHSRTTIIGSDESKYQKISGVYGVLICYTIDGEKRALRQDMTGSFKSKGFFETTLSYDRNSEVSSISVTYFNMIDEPRSNWPEKEDCY